MRKIMFSDKYHLTKAVLEGRKTQTRRIVKGANATADKAQYKVGEIVSIAQAYKDIMKEDSKRGVMGHPTVLEQNASDTAGWNNKMFVKARSMPHHIRITNVRVERLQDISPADCLAEGITRKINRLNNGEEIDTYSFENKDFSFIYLKVMCAYAALIDRISGKGTWDSNPFVFVYEFELVD